MDRLDAPFVTLTFPRSGSSWLMDLLNGHPEVVAYGELLRPGAEAGPGYGGDDISYFREYPASGDARRRAERVRQPLYLRTVFRARSGVRAVGFKLMYRQIRENPGLLLMLALRRVRMIHLVRVNLLDAVVSYEAAKRDGVFHPHVGDPVSSATVVLDTGELRQRLEQMEWAVARGRSWLERYRFPRIDVAYEELLGRRQETLERILHFLHVEPTAEVLDSRLARTAQGRSLDRVDNPEEVRTALQGTRFEWMLGDGPP